MNYLQLTFVFIWLFVSVSDVVGGRVLVLCPMSSQSHRNVMEGMYAGLADRGHEIVVVTSGKPSKPTKNVKEVLVFESFDYFKSMSTLEVRQGGLMGMLMGDYSFMFDYCRKIYENEEVKKIMNEHFDLIMYDAIGNQCTYGLAYKIGAPVITVSTCAATPAVVGKVGNRLPPSFVPDMSAPYTGEMTFVQRTANIFFSYITELMFQVDIDKYEAIYREYVGQDAPSAVEFEANASLILVNAHLSFDSPKPLLPDVIEVGGAHCRPGKPLPKELNDFVSGAKEGLILFSLGSIVKPHELPIEISKKFVNVFAKLKQRVLWKWPLEMNDLPPNVKLTKWVPQQDVLAHPNTKLFMTHGGLLSTQEAIYHGVPMIYFPVFGDQDNNAIRATAIGIGKFHEILDFTEEDLEASIREILKNSSYQEKIQSLAVIFKDQPQTPKERATFWAEYVMKHQGAPHLRSTARKLNFIQYHSLDSIAFILIVLSAILWAVKIAIVKAFRLCCSRSVSPPGTKKFN